MSKTDDIDDAHRRHTEDMWSNNHMKNWRAWGSWFSWGSPIGLGLFFLETAAAIWILAQVF